MKKILVVDNDALVLKFMVDILQAEGHEVLTVENGLTALDVLKTYVPDVLFVDLIMPNITGYKLCKIIRKTPKLRNIYVVTLSAVAAEEGQVNLAQLGANACIAKGPFPKMAKHVLDALAHADAGARTEPSGEIMGLEDIHPRAITQELLSVKRHFEIILESMSEGILEITHEARIIYVNPVASFMLGRPEEELLASNLIELFHEEDQQRTKELLDGIESTPRTIANDNPVRVNGKQLLLTALPLREEDHKVIIILSDVTEQKQIEAQLQQAQKMEAIGTLAGGIAHDFNNLLMGIQGRASLMLSDSYITQPYYRGLKDIEKLTQRGARLTRQLLAYAKKGRYEVKPINLNRLIEETSETFGRTKKEITIHLDLAEDLYIIEADQGQIEQVLLNLCVNASHAMPGGGDIFLKTMNLTHEDMKPNKLYNPSPGKYVLLSVTDTGIGMDEKTMKRIFDPFFTTRGMGRGTGLGLASVYGIVKGHNGYIDVDSRKGQGTIFRLYLPATEKKVPKDVKTGKQALKRTEKILLVDDEEMICEVGQELLESIGCHVLTAGDGKKAIGIYEKNYDTVDMVILDMIMPNMSGGEVYDRLKRINPDIKVLLLSGYSIDSQAHEILARGCNGFIQKPFRIEELSEKIGEILMST
ncbi:MAG: response regulator [Deltaproteobacteria bacterium]|nr:response regulator [Deltaproteobacteria bacterium]